MEESRQRKDELDGQTTGKRRQKCKTRRVKTKEKKIYFLCRYTELSGERRQGMRWPFNTLLTHIMIRTTAHTAHRQTLLKQKLRRMVRAPSFPSGYDATRWTLHQTSILEHLIVYPSESGRKSESWHTEPHIQRGMEVDVSQLSLISGRRVIVFESIELNQVI